MKISTRGRYGLKAVVDIAYHTQSVKCVSLKAIAVRHGISENYLEQIIAPLKKAGVLISVRGAGGGYYLSKSPEKITIGEILRVLEGSLAPVDCVVEDDAACGESDCNSCTVKPLWSKLFDSINNVVDSATIADLLKEEENASGLS
ncbi:MAG: Rrf2 family transcriptional regulator [Clostridiales bacterium]|jgi:Rrf2 family protein|nr:Rrf2 family transcriptional regulator [Clostridiales bacterium]